MRWPPKARKDWYVELKLDCFYFTRVLLLLSLSLSLLLLLFYFVPYTLFLTFTLFDFCVPVKRGFLDVSPFYANMNCFYLNPFYSTLIFLYFYVTNNFYSHSHYYYDYSCNYCFCHCHCHYFFIFNAFDFCFSSFLSFHLISVYSEYF